MQDNLNRNYENKYVCYMDILGFSNAIKNTDHQYYIRNLNFFCDAIDLLKIIPNKPDLFLKNQIVTQFSDCVVFSCNDDIPSLSIMLDRIRELQNKLLEGGLPTRGAITKGSIYHNQNYTIGPALVCAVHLEEKASTPRVVIDDDILKNIMNHEIIEFKINKDDDNIYYVKYIEYWQQNDISGLLHLRNTIIYGLRDKDIRDKYEWLAKKFNNRLASKNVSGVQPINLSVY